MAKILIVEDDIVIAEDIRSKVKKLGHSPIGIVYKGESVTDKLVAQRPDLILLDIELQGQMSGIDVALHLNQKFKIPFVYITSYADRATIERVKSTNPLGYLVKPFSQDDIRVSIEMALFRIEQKKMGIPSREQLNRILNINITETEYEIILDVKRGLTNDEIAMERHNSVNTVKAHIKSIYRKCQVNKKSLLIDKLLNLN